MTTQASTNGSTGVPAKREPTMSERFTEKVMAEFLAVAGTSAPMGPEQRRLAQHLFLHVDTKLKEHEAKRIKDGKTDKAPIVWNNINMEKLALDSVHRIDLGLDALIPNHISPIPHFNAALKKYDLDLRVGYVGKDLYRRRCAVEEPLNVIYELVYETDKFVAHKRGPNNEAETYTFEVTQPFDRGKVVGGFGYVMYGDPCKNMLVLVSEASFKKSEGLSKTASFWRDHPIEMRYGKLVHRVTDKLRVDPRKVGASFAAVEAADNGNELAVDAEVAEEANQTPLDVDPDTGEVKNEATPQAEAVAVDPGTDNTAESKEEGKPGF